MRHIVEKITCDKCGCEDTTRSTNVPNLGWVFIDTAPQGIPLPTPIRVDLCPLCWHEVWGFINGEEKP